MKDLKVVFLGTPDFVKPIKDTLAKHFTLVDEVRELGSVDSLNEADLGVIAAYGHILTTSELNAPKYGCINIHPSLLPKYRGASPIQETILHGDKTTGISIIKMDEEVDHGPIIYTSEISLSGQDTFDNLSKKMFGQAATILPQIIEDFINGKIKPKEQDHTKATFCERLTRESGYFDIDNPPDPKTLDKMIRAYYPWPGVWTKWVGKIVKFLPSPRHPELVSGSKQIDSDFRQNDEKFLIQMEGKKAVSYKDFLNGYPNFPLMLNTHRLTSLSS